MGKERDHRTDILIKSDEVVEVFLWYRCDTDAAINVQSIEGWKRTPIGFYKPCARNDMLWPILVPWPRC